MATKELARPQPTQAVNIVEFFHPAYPGKQLFQLNAYDGEGASLDYGVALTACCIVAAGQPGYLTTERDGPPVVEPDNSLLTGGKYYYHVTDDTYPSGEYPICPSFSHWRFPHDGKYPAAWPNEKVESSVKAELRTNRAASVKARDKWCIVSARQDWLEHAHIVPVALNDWFNDNNMQRYVEPVNEAHGVHAAANMIMLCHDMHLALDHHCWAPVP
jgi:hypothetical protein